MTWRRPAVWAAAAVMVKAAIDAIVLLMKHE